MKKILLAGVGFVALCIMIITLWFAAVLRNLPDVSLLKNYRPAAAAEVLDRDGALLTHYYDKKFRIWVPISGIPDNLIQAVVTAEDDTFFGHKGVNYQAVWDALMHDVHKHRFSRGGSTITQQMIKNVLLTKEKTLSRKVREYVLAQKAEKILTKRRILEIYLNEVEWGENLHGIEAASRYYLDKHVSELTIAESALLAGMLPNPRYYNPFKRMDKTRARQEKVLFNMQQAKLISQDEYSAALRSAPRLRQDGAGRFDLAVLAPGSRPCYQNVLEDVLSDLFSEQDLYRSGMAIHTTIDKTLQDKLAEEQRGLKPSTPEQSIVVRQNGVIRAILCSGADESAINAKLDPVGGYDIGMVQTNSIDRAAIILSTGGEGIPR